MADTDEAAKAAAAEAAKADAAAKTEAAKAAAAEADPRDARIAELEAQVAAKKAAKGKVTAAKEYDGVPMVHDDPAATCSHGAVDYGPDEDGIIVVPHAAVEDLKAHGFRVAGA